VDASQIAGQYGAPNLGSPPPPQTTRLGTLVYKVHHVTDQGPADEAGVGDTVTATVTTTEPGTWLCGGENTVAAGISDVYTELAGLTSPTYTPSSLQNGKVTLSPPAVEWKSGPPTGSCADGNGSPDGLLPPGNYVITYKLSAANASPTAPQSWGVAETAITNEQGSGLAYQSFAPLDCTCTLSPSTTTLTPGAEVTVTGTHWKDGTVNLVLGDVLVATVQATGSGSFSAQFSTPAILAPPPEGHVEFLQLHAIGPGNHDLAQDMAYN
jgi:hypothetical protein